jgi:hypothetical protein
MKTKTPKQARAEAQAKLEAITATVEARAMEKTLALIESPQPVVVPWTEYPGFDEYGGATSRSRPYYWSAIDDRTEGRWRPQYESDNDLRRMRAESRRFKAFFPVAEAALETLTNYVIGPGFEFNAQPKPGKPECELVGMVQSVIDRFLEYNDFNGSLDREIHVDSRIDGDVFATLYPEETDVRIELVSPDSIVEPARPEPLNRMLGTGHKLNQWWLGVHTLWNQHLKCDDSARPLGYHAVFDHHGDQWDYLPSVRVEHIKRNVGRKARRGVGDFDIIARDLELNAKLLRNTAEGAAILAAIVMIRQHPPGVTRSSIESMVSNSATTTYERQVASGTRTTNVEQMRPGTVKDVPNGMQAMLGPLGSLNSPVYIEVDKHILRRIWHRWNAPEMLTGDASNANYASSLVAEGPFVKSREGDQGKYGAHFVNLIWKALKMYHAAGAFGVVTWQQLREYITINAKGPEVASRDKLQQAQVNEILHRNKIISKRTWAAETGLDYDEELDELAQEPSPAPQPMVPFGGDPFGRDPSQLAYEARRDAIAFSLLE